LDDTITCLVRGPASRYPHGFVWLFAAWFAILSFVVVAIGFIANGRVSFWLDAAEVAGLLVAACTAVLVLLTARRIAFRADSLGVLLGSARRRKRPKLHQVYLPWTHVAQVGLVPRRYGVLVQLVLSPAALPVHRPSTARQAALLLGALVMPIGFGRGHPALTLPRANPPGYRVKICEISAGELRLALAQVKPDGVPILVLNSMAALRISAARTRPPGSLRLNWPTRQLGQAAGKRPPTTAGRP
jgi:hypothetical protein